MSERKNFDEQLLDLRGDLIKLAARVTEMIGAATQALLDGDLAVADQVYGDHQAVFEASHSIEQRTYQLFALQQPMAADLRSLLATLRVLHELELTAGLMRNVARATRRLYPRELPPRIRGIIQRMGSQATNQMQLAVDAFADSDPAAASALADMDDAMDDLQKELFRAIFAVGASDESEMQQAVQTAFLGRDYERAADHAVMIGRWVCFVATGAIPGTESADKTS